MGPADAAIFLGDPPFGLRAHLVRPPRWILSRCGPRLVPKVYHADACAKYTMVPPQVQVARPQTSPAARLEYDSTAPGAKREAVLQYELDQMSYIQSDAYFSIFMDRGGFQSLRSVLAVQREERAQGLFDLVCGIWGVRHQWHAYRSFWRHCRLY